MEALPGEMVLGMGLHIHAGGDGRGGEGCSRRRELPEQKPGLVRAWSPEGHWPGT